ncbi:hypothetical protein BH24ACT5_BH24ACT5_01590 [soil metagenome]
MLAVPDPQPGKSTVRARSDAPAVLLIGALASLVMSFGLPWVRSTAGTTALVLPGYAHSARVFLMVALGSLVMVAVHRRSRPVVAERAASVALVVLMVVVARNIRLIPQPGIVLAVSALGLTFFLRRTLPRR